MEIDQARRVIEKRIPDHELRERMATALSILLNTHYEAGRGYDDIAVMDACRQLEGSSPVWGVVATKSSHELQTLRATVRAMEAVVARARLISPSPSMVCYVADLERALGHQAPHPHKMGVPSAS